MTNRIALFEKALASSRQAFAKAPYMFPLAAVIDQLQYLLNLETGKTLDRAALGTITIVQIAARDIETFDPELADLLHDVSAQVRLMTGT